MNNKSKWIKAIGVAATVIGVGVNLITDSDSFNFLVFISFTSEHHVLEIKNFTLQSLFFTTYTAPP